MHHRFASPERRLHSSMDYSDVCGTRPRPLSRAATTGALSTLSTHGIERSSPWSRTRREVLSPGRGTLYSQDIAGTSPGPSAR